MIKNIDNLLADENIDKVAQYIVDKFMAATPETRDSENEFVDIDFDLNKGEMKSLPTNTRFFVDAEEDSVLYDIVHAFYTDDKECLPKDEQEELLKELGDDFDRLEVFIENIKSKLENEFKDSIIEAVRKNLLEGVDSQLMPMNDIEIKDLYLSNPVFPYTLRILKGRTIEEMEDKKVGDKSSISQDLLNKHLDTKKSFEEIIAIEKAMGNDKYRYVFGVEKIKSEYNCHLYMWIDYSLAQKETVKGIGIVEQAG